MGRDLEALFGGNSTASLGDGQLLDCFLERDERGEQAFGTLVERHGPMVYRVCRQVLGDGHEADDAFQAVFLVLARRAGSVRSRDSLGSWLYGVALRVAARARSGFIRRRIREQRTDCQLELIPEEQAQALKASSEDVAAVHQEVDRLSEKYRAPIVLCYLEGLTHDQAAARLKWPVGTVRSRLARGRDQLRGRLSRRGVTAPGAMGPLAPWLAVGTVTTAEVSTIASATLATVPAGLIGDAVRTSCQIAHGKASTVALFSSSSFVLSKGVLRSMALQKLGLVFGALLPTGALAIATGAMIGQPSGSRNLPGTAVILIQDAKQPVADERSRQRQSKVPPSGNASRTQRTGSNKLMRIFKPNGSDTSRGESGLSHSWKPSKSLALAEHNQARGTLVDQANRHLSRLLEIEAHEQAELKAGRGSQSWVGRGPATDQSRHARR